MELLDKVVENNNEYISNYLFIRIIRHICQ